VRKNILLLLLPVIFISGLLAGYLLTKQLAKCESNYTYVNKAFNCGLKRIINKSNLMGLRQKLNLYIESNKKAGNVSEVSIYFRDLHEGPTLGINDDERFFSASLLKLPIALVFFKLKEEIPDILKRELNFKTTQDYKPQPQAHKPSKTISVGSSYTVEELIYYSLVYSDNLSNDVLKSTFGIMGDDRQLDLKVFRDLGLIFPTDNELSDISTRGYASIFRILYNVSYLGIEDSDKLLSMLSQSDFDQGISAGVPKDVKVANKFGERADGQEKQLHDCGIVYYPGNPYLICIMTRGGDFTKLEKVIADISGMVYQEIDSRKLD